MVKKYMNMIINMPLYLEKDLKFVLKELGVENLIVKSLEENRDQYIIECLYEEGVSRLKSKS